MKTIIAIAIATLLISIATYMSAKENAAPVCDLSDYQGTVLCI